jgi:hypothetical protein
VLEVFGDNYDLFCISVIFSSMVFNSPPKDMLLASVIFVMTSVAVLRTLFSVICLVLGLVT